MPRGYSQTWGSAEEVFGRNPSAEKGSLAFTGMGHHTRSIHGRPRNTSDTSCRFWTPTMLACSKTLSRRGVQSRSLMSMPSSWATGKSPIPWVIWSYKTETIGLHPAPTSLDSEHLVQFVIENPAEGDGVSPIRHPQAFLVCSLTLRIIFLNRRDDWSGCSWTHEKK